MNKKKNRGVLPNFFVPGAAKSATSTLHELLNQHPDIFMSKKKEPHYFTNNSDISEFDNYTKLFEGKEHYQVRGESSTGYLIFPEAAVNIKSRLKQEIKFIIILRNPIDRAFSHYNWLRGKGLEMRKFREAFLSDSSFDIEDAKNVRPYKYYYQFGLYFQQVERFYKLFSKKRILIITTEELKKNPLCTINRCFEFLKVEKINSINHREINKSRNIKWPKIYFGIKSLFLKGVNFFNKKLSFEEKNILFKKKIDPYLIKIFYCERPKLNDVDRKWLKKYYEIDVLKLKKLTRLEFKEWQDFL